MVKAPARRTQEERSASTRAAILRAARDLFSERGYAATGLDEVVAAAGVTRGALYHHFRSKSDVFRVVVDQIDEELLAEVLREAGSAGPAGGPGDSPAAWIRRAARGYVEVCARMKVSRIGAELESVLGPDTYREISAARCLPLATMAGETAAAAGVSLPGDGEVLATLILASLNEAASMYAQARSVPSKARILDTVEGVIDRILAAG